MTVAKAHITFFVVTAGQYVAIGHPPIVENIHRGVRTFRTVSNGLFFAKHNLASRRTDAGVFEWMPGAEVVDGSYAIALAAGVEAPTVHRVTLIIGPVGSVAGRQYLSIRVVPVGAATEQIAAGAGAQVSHNQAVLERVGGQVVAPINPVVDLKP